MKKALNYKFKKKLASTNAHQSNPVMTCTAAKQGRLNIESLISGSPHFRLSRVYSQATKHASRNNDMINGARTLGEVQPARLLVAREAISIASPEMIKAAPSQSIVSLGSSPDRRSSGGRTKYALMHTTLDKARAR